MQLDVAKSFAKGRFEVAESRAVRVELNFNKLGEVPTMESDWDDIEEREAARELVESRAVNVD